VKAAIGLLVALFSVGCGADPSCAREPALNWDNFGQGFTSTWCAGCHSSLLEGADRHEAPVDIDYNDLGKVLAGAERFAARATGDSPTMPPAGGPADEEVALLDEWLTCSVLPASRGEQP